MPRADGDSDAYIAGFAAYVALNLGAAQKVYVEFGQNAPGWMALTQAMQVRLEPVARVGGGLRDGRLCSLANGRPPPPPPPPPLPPRLVQ